MDQARVPPAKSNRLQRHPIHHLEMMGRGKCPGMAEIPHEDAIGCFSWDSPGFWSLGPGGQCGPNSNPGTTEQMKLLALGAATAVSLGQ